MSLHLYDTATRSVRAFEPLVPGEVTIYNCGATVQAAPHIGHARGAGIVYDVLRRWLEFSGYRVTQIRNVTDIDDKILVKAAEAGRPWWALAAANEQSFSDAYRILGCQSATAEPRATGHIPQILTMIGELVEAGKAYAATGDVYFSVHDDPEYGFLSGQRVDEMEQGETAAQGKKDPADFTLWKAAKPGEPAWESPWGPGRPGWHIECSAMARTYLGDTFDIHGGGLDLVFPHHENEAAQSHGVGLGFARYWVHSSWVTLAGEKMSKSLGNTMTVQAITERVRPIDLRYYLVSVHYRSSIEYSDGALDDAAKAFGRIETFLRRTANQFGDVAVGEPAEAFVAAMDDDLGVPKALAVVHELVRAGNAAVDAGERDVALSTAANVRAMLAVLGLDPLDPQWADAAGAAPATAALEVLVEDLIEQRQRARAERDFATADRIRDQLVAAGVAVEDGPSGTTWTLATTPKP